MTTTMTTLPQSELERLPGNPAPLYVTQETASIIREMVEHYKQKRHLFEADPAKPAEPTSPGQDRQMKRWPPLVKDVKPVPLEEFPEEAPPEAAPQPHGWAVGDDGEVESVTPMPSQGKVAQYASRLNFIKGNTEKVFDSLIYGVKMDGQRQQLDEALIADAISSVEYAKAKVLLSIDKRINRFTIEGK